MNKIETVAKINGFYYGIDEIVFIRVNFGDSIKGRISKIENEREGYLINEITIDDSSTFSASNKVIKLSNILTIEKEEI